MVRSGISLIFAMVASAASLALFFTTPAPISADFTDCSVESGAECCLCWQKPTGGSSPFYYCMEGTRPEGDQASECSQPDLCIHEGCLTPD